MHLWIDGQCLQTTSRFRGIGRYVTELIRAIGETSAHVEMSISLNAALGDTVDSARLAVERWITPRNIHLWQSAASKPELRSGYDDGRRLSEIALAHHVACLAPDVALSASPFEGQHDLAAPLLARVGHDFPLAAIFFDAIPHRYPARYLGKRRDADAYGRRLAAHGGFDLLLAISGFAAREARGILPGVPVVQIDAGVSSDFLELAGRPADPAILQRLNIRKPFILYVGALDWRKNVLGVVEGFRRLAHPLRDQLKFVMAGDVGDRDLAKLRAAWAQAGLAADQLCVLGHVNDETLVQLNRHTDLAVQPSLMEGFGLTALEAMHCGAPVIAANAGALPEIVGDPRALFHPEKPDEIAARMTEILSQPALAHALVEQGIIHAREFSWARTARLAVEALQAMACRKAPRYSLDTIRDITLRQLNRRQCASDRTAQILAMAEPGASVTAPD